MSTTGNARKNQASDEFEVITRVTVQGGARVVVKITTEAIQNRGRAACIAMVAAKIRSFAGKLPPEVVVSTSDFR
jgi:hypothetical protein